MATSNLLSLLKPLLPARKPNEKGTALTPSYNPASPSTVLTVPTYRDHLTDIYASRISSDSRTLIKQLMQMDPDVSGAMNAFLTVADTWPIIVCKDADGVIDRAGQKTTMQLVTALTVRTDYTKGFQAPKSLTAITEACRYMILMRGAIAGELILNKAILPASIRLVDYSSLEWYEKTPGIMSPVQKTADGREVSLDIPTFMTATFRQDPTTVYTTSYFVSAINTIAARQQVINDLYRIMQLTGYPRLHVSVLEEVVLKNAPPLEVSDGVKKTQYVNTQLRAISQAIANIRPDQAFVHTDSVEVSMLNEKNPGMALDIEPIIEALNAQNQAGLRTMATILGRGTMGVNTASVEARIFALNAQALNEPVADFLSQMLTLALRLTGSESRVEVTFQEVELRSTLELETQKVVRSTRLLHELSLGMISDDEYHLQMHGRLAPDDAPLLSGTNFDAPAPEVDTDDISANSDAMGRSVSAPGGTKGARDNASKTKGRGASTKAKPATAK